MAFFELATAARIVFGAGKHAEAPAALAEMGAKRALVVSGQRGERAAAMVEALRARGIEAERASVAGEPTVAWVREATRAAARCDAVLAIGGGSAIDAGKAIAALVANGGDPLDYLEVIGQGRPLTRPSLPFVAIPTTAGTGSEVTRNAVLGSKEHGVKASLRSAHMLPRLSIVDPELLVGAPAEVLRSSGLDALSQLIEPFLSARAQPLTDALAREGMRRSARSLPRSARGEGDAGAREDLALASLCGGICLANAGLGAVHGFAAPAGAMLDAPHGAVCAALLAATMETNLGALRARAPDHPAAARFAEVAAILTGRAEATAEEGIAWVRALCADLGVPGLRSYGLCEEDVPALCAKAKAASSMKANPIALTDEELRAIAVGSMGT